MFAATTAEALTVSDPGTLKKYPTSIPSCLDLIEAPTASSWSPDNTYLYISSSYIVHRYEPTSNFLKDVYTHPRPISCLAVKDRHCVIFASEDGIHVLECDPNPHITQTFDSHKNTITSLSLSNDNSLLCSTSSEALLVHNLALGSHAVMRGLPTQDIVTSTFHPHARTRLLVAAGKQLLVYDTTRPSGPVKSIVMNDSVSGEISAVACSPFSKTLVAVATVGGFVGLIDLEKEKALFRTLNLKIQITTIGFSPEGAAIYFGTATGKILILDLRALDKPSRTIALNDTASRVVTISVQRKIKSAEGTTKTPVGANTVAKKLFEPIPATRRATSTVVGQTSKSASKPSLSPTSMRTVTGGNPTSPVARRVPSVIKEGGSSRTPTKGASKDLKQVLSPVRDPLGNSGSGSNIAGQLNEIGDRKRGKTTTPIKAPPKSTVNPTRPRPSPSRSNTISKTTSSKTETENPRRARTLPTSTSASVVSNRKPSTTSISTSASATDHLSVTGTGLSPVRKQSPRRQRTVSSASRTGSEAVSAISSNSRSTKSGTAASSSSASRPSSSASRPASSLTTRLMRDPSPIRSKVNAPRRSELSRTPSPDLPDIHLEPVTPVPVKKQKNKGMDVLGLGTPEVDRWIQAGKEKEIQRKAKDLKGKGKNVGFQDDLDENASGDDNDVRERERTLSMQISPRRPLPGTSASGSGSADSWAASPPNPLTGTSSIPAGGASGSSAQKLLKTIVQDVMYDFQQETKSEMMGLHLDLLRMGRGWKTELRTLMDEYVGDLRDLREENQRLRLENERLKRGYY